jgi:hypothetical protein
MVPMVWAALEEHMTFDVIAPDGDRVMLPVHAPENVQVPAPDAPVQTTLMVWPLLLQEPEKVVPRTAPLHAEGSD